MSASRAYVFDQRVARPDIRRLLRAPILLLAPAFVLLFVFLVLPYLTIVVMSFRVPASIGVYGPGFTTSNYTRALTDGYYLGVLGQTIRIGIATTICCFAIGLPIAYQLGRSRGPLVGFLYTLVLTPLLVGVVARSFGWLIILSGNGVINTVLRHWGMIDAPLPLMNNEFGVILGLTHVFLPVMILPVLGSVLTIKPTIEQAARSLGAGSFTIFWRIGIPMCMPGIQSGSILVFVLAISAYVTPVLLGGPQQRTMTVLIVQQLIDNFQWPFGAALALILAIAATATVLIFVKLTAFRTEVLR